MTVDYSRLAPAPGSRIVLAGGAGGIGRELVSACRALGHEVVVLDLQPSIDGGAKLDGVDYIAFDGADPASITTAIASVATKGESVDGFVFLSGYPILPRRPLQEVSLADWNSLMDVNLRSAYLLITGFLPLFAKAKTPAVVTVASSLAYQVMPGMAAYATSKGGLVSLTKALAMENAPRIRVNAVAPGAVDTSFLGGGTGREDMAPDRSWFDSMSDKYVATIPLGRVAEPADVAGPILFLLGSASSYMTGQVLHLNGGRLTP